MKRKILSMFAVLAVAVSMVGCAEQIYADVPVEDTGEIVVETTSQTKELSSSEAKQALSFDEVNRIEINGVEVSLPFKIEDLGEGYSVGKVQGFDNEVPSLCYDNKFVCVVKFDNENNIISTIFTSDAFKDNEIKIYSLSSNDNFERIINKIGSPTKQKKMALIYEYEQGDIYFGSEDGFLGFNYLEISLNGGTNNE